MHLTIKVTNQISQTSHAALNPCGGNVDNFIILSYDREPTGPQKDSKAVILMR